MAARDSYEFEYEYAPPTPGYWVESRLPLASCLFVIPMLVIYEAGVLMLGPLALRNGADVWLRQFLDGLGFSQYFLLPALTCGLLLAWHHMRRDRWGVRWSVLFGMLFESILFGLALLVLARLQGSLLGALPQPASTPWEGVDGALLGRLIGFFGAGIYEELLFRLMLLPATMLLLRAIGLSTTFSLAAAVLATSLAFSAAHYQIDMHVAGFHVFLPRGDVFEWGSFVFRATAGAFFAVLFVYRGFGIAVGAHALYDIFVVTL